LKSSQTEDKNTPKSILLMKNTQENLQATVTVTLCPKSLVAHLMITIHQLLLTEAQELASSQIVCTLNCAGGAERPARTASALQNVNKYHV